MPGPGGGFEDVGLRATIQNVGGFEAAAQRINSHYTKLGEASTKTAAQTKVAAASIGTGMTTAAERATIGFNNTSKGMMQMAGRAAESEMAIFKLLRPLTQIGFAIFGITAVASAMGMLGRAVLGASTQWEQFEVTFKTLLRSATLGTKKLEELSDFARRTPFTLPEVVEASKQMLAYGFSADRLIPILTAVGDAAAGLGKEKLPFIIRALGQMQAKTKVSAEEMLQLTEAGIPAWQILADAMKLPVAKLQDLVSKGVVPANAAIQVLLAGMEKRFGGLMEEQSKTFGGMLSNMQDWVYRAQVIFTKPIFERVKAQFGNFLALLDTPQMTDSLKRWGEAAGAGLDIFIRAVTLAARIAVPTFQAIAGVVQATVSTVGRPLRSLAIMLGADLGTALQVSAVAFGVWAAVVSVRAVAAIIAWGIAAAGALAQQIAWNAFLVQYAIVSAGQFAAAVGGATVALVVYAARGTAAALKATGELIIMLVREGIPAFLGLSATILTRAVPAMVIFAVAGMGSIVRGTPAALKSLGLLAVAFSVTSVQATVAATRIAAAWVAAMLPAVVSAVGAALAALAPFAVAIAAIAAIAGAVAVAWANNWGDIQGITSRVLGWVADRIGDFIAWLETVPIIGGAVGQVRKWIGATVDTFRTQAPKLVAAAGDAVGNLVDQFRHGFPEIQKIIGGIFEVPKIEIGPEQWAGFAGGADRADEAVKGLGFDLADLGEKAKSGGDTGRAALRELERQVSDTKDEVKRLEEALKDAQDAMRGFSDPRLVGMQAAEDDIFALELAVKQAKLAELQMGDAAKKASKDVGTSFDLLAAQQRELAEGIPVAFQRAAFEAEQAKRRAEQDRKKSEKDKGKDEETESERLQRLLDIRRLQKEITFEPLLRQLRERFETLTGANKELTFEAAASGLEASAQQALELTGQLDQQKAVLDVQQTILEGAKRAYEDQNDAAKALGTTRDENLGIENLILAAQQSQTAELEKQAAMAAQIGAQAPPAQAAAAPEVGPAQWAGFAGGGAVGRGGMARVGERGAETVLLPAGAQVVSPGAMGATSMSRSESNTFNIHGARDTTDVVDAVRRYMAFRRITQGRS